MNTTTSKWMQRLAGVTTLLMVSTSFVGQASARILFQDDTTGVFESENLNIGSNDLGANNTSVKFGADVTASENGNITWNVGTNSFSVDHTVDVTGGLSATGQVNFSGAAGIRLREDATPNTTAACATLNEVIMNTTTHKLMVCTTIGIAGVAVWTAPSPAVPTGGPGNPGTCAVGDLFFNTASSTLQICTATNTWNTAGPQDFESVFNYDADKTLTTGNTAFTIATGSGALNLDTGASTGAVSIGGGLGTLAINTTSWDISSTGAATGFTGITSTGDVNFSQADSTRIQESTDPATLVGCSALGELILDTTDNQIQVCTATGSNAVAATLVNQTITYTADTAGTSGNALTVTLVETAAADLGGDGATINVAKVGNNITVTFQDDSNANPESVGQQDIAQCINSAISITTAGSGATPGNGIACTITNNVTAFVTATGGTATTDAVALGLTNLASGLNGTATWTATTAGDASTLDGIDSTQFLRSDTSDNFTSGTLTFDNTTALTLANGSTLNVNGVANIGDNGDNVVINSNTWDVSGAGVISGLTGITSANGTISLNSNSAAFTTDIGTGTTTGTVSIGGGANQVAINSSTWDISGAGAASGLTTIDASGNITTSGGQFCIGTTCLNETTSATDSGAYLVGAFDEFTNSNSATVQGVLNDLDALIGSNAPNAEQLTFYPEYPDVVVYRDGSSNNGTLVSDYDSANLRQYYGWTTSRATLQDVDLRFRYKLPADWATTGNLTLQIRTLTIAAGDNAIDLTLKNETDSATCGTSTGNVSGVANTWGTVTMTAGTIGTGCTGATALNAGDIVEIIITNFAKSTGASDVGAVALDYNN